MKSNQRYHIVVGGTWTLNHYYCGKNSPTTDRRTLNEDQVPQMIKAALLLGTVNMVLIDTAAAVIKAKSVASLNHHSQDQRTLNIPQRLQQQDGDDEDIAITPLLTLVEIMLIGLEKRRAVMEKMRAADASGQSANSQTVRHLNESEFSENFGPSKKIQKSDSPLGKEDVARKILDVDLSANIEASKKFPESERSGHNELVEKRIKTRFSGNFRPSKAEKKSQSLAKEEVIIKKTLEDELSGMLQHPKKREEYIASENNKLGERPSETNFPDNFEPSKEIKISESSVNEELLKGLLKDKLFHKSTTLNEETQSTNETSFKKNKEIPYINANVVKLWLLAYLELVKRKIEPENSVNFEKPRKMLEAEANGNAELDGRILDTTVSDKFEPSKKFQESEVSDRTEIDKRGMGGIGPSKSMLVSGVISKSQVVIFGLMFVVLITIKQLIKAALKYCIEKWKARKKENAIDEKKKEDTSEVIENEVTSEMKEKENILKETRAS